MLNCSGGGGGLSQGKGVGVRKAGHPWGQGRTGKFHELIPPHSKAFGSESKGLLFLSVLLMDSSGSII